MIEQAHINEMATHLGRNIKWYEPLAPTKANAQGKAYVLHLDGNPVGMINFYGIMRTYDDQIHGIDVVGQRRETLHLTCALVPRLPPMELAETLGMIRRVARHLGCPPELLSDTKLRKEENLVTYTWAYKP